MRMRWHVVAPVLIVTFAGTAWGQRRADAIRYYSDRSKTPPVITSRNGTVTAESPVKVTILTGLNRQPLDIRSVDVVEIRYGNEPVDMTQARSAENAKDWARAQSAYEAALRKAPANNKFLKAQIEFGIARALVRQADTAPELRPLAIDALRKFKDKYPDSRQIIDALDLLSRMLVLQGQSPQEVVEAFRQLREKHRDSPDVTNRCDLFESRLLLEEGQLLLAKNPQEAKARYAAAQAKLQSMLKGASKESAVAIRIGLAECKSVLGDVPGAIRDLEQILRETPAEDYRTRAMAYLGLGDCHRLNGQYREAMWDYLFVDVVYNQDREQHAKALYYLQEVFDAMADTDPQAALRARECRDRLRNDPRLKDTRYQKLLAGK